MLNEPPDHERRRVHPLERQPAPPPEPRQQVMLHIPVVTPYITWALIGVNILIYALGAFSSDLHTDLFYHGVNNQTAVFVYGEYLRLFSSMFLHASVAHIFFNMYSLYVIGSNLEGLFGHVRYAIIYILGGLTGSLASAILGGAGVFSVGASGAVFALFGADIVYLYKHRKLYGKNATERLRSLLIVAAMNLAVGFLGSATGGAQIDNWAHLGGLLGGIAVTWFISPLFLLRKHPDHEGAFIAEDVNPLSGRYHVVSLYTAGLLAVLIGVSLAMR